MLTFTQALIFFTIFLTIFYFILLIFHTKKSEPKMHTRAIPRFLTNIVNTILLSLILTSMILSSEKNSSFFRTFYVAVSALLFFTIMLNDMNREKSKFSTFLLTTTILFHITTLLNSWMTYVFPIEGIAMGERTAAKLRLSLYGYWNQEWEMLNPTYNPFPADVATYVILSMISDLPLSTHSLDSILITLLIITFDITIYILTKQITGDIVTGLIAILLVTLTPPLNVAAHTPRSMAILGILVIISFLLRNYRSRRIVLITVILYFAAIFYHLMAAQIIFILISLTVLPYALSLLSNIIRRNISNNFNLRNYSILLLLFFCMSNVKIFWTEGAPLQVISPLRTLFNYILNLQSVPETSLPNYGKFISPIYAFSWSILPSLATAMAIQYMLNIIQSNLVKKEYLESLGLYLGGAILALLGFLMAISGAGFHPDIYPSMFFIVPMASIAFLKIMKSIRLGSLILFLCLILASGISIRDPMLNIFSYAEIGGAADTPPKFMNWYIEGVFFATTAKSDYLLFAPYEIGAYLSYIRVVNESYEYKFFGGSAELRREMLNKIERASDVRGGVLYIWPIWWPLGVNVVEHITDTGRCLNVFYASGRYITFMKI